MATFLSNVANRVLNQNPLVEKATEDNETPTPGYLYSDIAKLTYGGGEECDKIANQLLKKLDSKSAAVKVKVLMVMKHLLEQGHPSFQRIMARASERIGANLSMQHSPDFRGPPDPLRGDAPYRVVREKTQLVMNLLFETRNVNQASQTGSSYTPATGGMSRFGNGGTTPMSSMGSHMGSGISSTGGGGSNAMGNRFRGVGGGSRGGSGFAGVENTPGGGMSNGSGGSISNSSSQWSHRGPTSISGGFQPPPQKESSIITNVMSGIKNKLGLQDDTPSVGGFAGTGTGRYRPSGGGFYPRGSTLSGHSNHTTVSTEVAFQNDDPMQAGKPGGGWGDYEEDGNGNEDQDTPEYKMVDEICTPGIGSATRLPPTRQQIAIFMGKIRNSPHPDYVFYLLHNVIQSDNNWKRRLRALYTIHESLREHVDPCKSYFASDGWSSIEALTSSPQKTLRDKATQLLNILRESHKNVTGNISTVEVGNSHVQDSGSVDSASADLLSGVQGDITNSTSGGGLFGNMTTTPSDNSTLAVATSVEKGPGPSLLGSIDSNDESTEGSLFGNMKSNNTTPSGGSLFDIISGGGDSNSKDVPLSTPTLVTPTTVDTPVPNESTLNAKAGQTSRGRGTSSSQLAELFDPKEQAKLAARNVALVQNAASAAYPPRNANPPGYGAPPMVGTGVPGAYPSYNYPTRVSGTGNISTYGYGGNVGFANPVPSVSGQTESGFGFMGSPTTKADPFSDLVS